MRDRSPSLSYSSGSSSSSSANSDDSSHFLNSSSRKKAKRSHIRGDRKYKNVKDRHPSRSSKHLSHRSEESVSPSSNEDKKEYRVEASSVGLSGTSKISHKKLRRLRDELLAEKFGYCNESNPFNDSTLSAQFVWKKKQKILQAAGRSQGKLLPAAYLEQTHKKICEIENVKKRREAREEEERMLEEQQAILARERELEHYEEWENREETFHREMALRRTEIRLKQGRERISDLLVKELRLADGNQFKNLTILSCYPHHLFNDLQLEDMEELIKDIDIHHDISLAATASLDKPEDNWVRSLEKMVQNINEEEDEYKPSPDVSAGHLKFWRSMQILAAEAIKQKDAESNANRFKNSVNSDTPNSLNKIDNAITSCVTRDQTTGIALSVLNDVHKLLESRTEKELEIIELQVIKKKKLIKDDSNSSEDLTYWDAIHDRIPYYKAVAECSRVHHAAISRVKELRLLRDKQHHSLNHCATNRNVAPHDVCIEKVQHMSLTPKSQIIQNSSIQKEMLLKEKNVFQDFWPPLLPLSSFKQLDIVIIDINDALLIRNKLKQKLIQERRLALFGKTKQHDTKDAIMKHDTLPNDSLYAKFVSAEQDAMTEDEFIMTPAYEVPLPLSHTQGSEEWDSKYQPRKPKFFNRVRTGYEWSKYNQTHYDRDNPPPKSVQGYKLNLFYPDLIDKTKSPTWKLLPSDTTETILIHFHAGPPYEDVVFKIINREWDLNPRSGFKNTFDRGILQLHFNFKRYRYRR